MDCMSTFASGHLCSEQQHDKWGGRTVRKASYSIRMK